MSTLATHARYQIHLAAAQTVERELALSQPIYEIVTGLVREYGLSGSPDQYTFFVGADRRPLIRELSLQQTPHAHGGELFLAPTNAPWWIAVSPDPSLRSSAGAILQRRSLHGVSPQIVALCCVLALAACTLLWLLWPSGSAQPRPVAVGASPVSAPAVAAAPTATLLPVPTAPTLDAATEQERRYQTGLLAYQQQRWADASAELQPLYDKNPAYRDIVELLSAAYYNRGYALREQGEIGAALEQFSSALAVAPGHPLARGERELAMLYLDGRAAGERGERGAAIEQLRALIARQPAYADGAQRLFDLLVQQADELRAAKREGDLQLALTLYREAATLPVTNPGAAEAGATRVAALLPTPTARPDPTPTARAAARLRFRVLNYDDEPGCISVRISGIVPAGWFFVIDGIGIQGRFDRAGNARACGLQSGQEVTLSVLDGNGTPVLGGGGVPAKGSAIMAAAWR